MLPFNLTHAKALLTMADCQTHLFANADYEKTHQAMLDKTLAKIAQKKAGTPLPDELWVVEHNDVYTLGQAGKVEHILQKTTTPIIKTDRGGQVTWHGKGQLVLYFLFDLNALDWSVRQLVSHAEQAIEDTINPYLTPSLFAQAKQDAPGVYIFSNTATTSNHIKQNSDNQNSTAQDNTMLGKIASLGFKIKHGHSYHGIAINLNNDLSAFSAINPCGYAGMTMVKLSDFNQVDSGVFIAQLLDNIHKRRQGVIALRPTQATTA